MSGFLTLISGTPGAGKTLHGLQLVKRENIPQKGDVPRPVFVNGIPELDYRYFGARELEDPEKWQELPDGSIIVIDEAQRVFPQRSASKEVPEFAKAIATLRHSGYSMILITQDGMNIDAFVRRLVGRHLHVHRLLSRDVATVYEYDHYEANPCGYHEKKAAVSVTPWRYPKELYRRYKSATLHTARPRTPWKVYALPLIALASVGMLWFGINSVMSKGDEMQGSAAVEPAVLRFDEGGSAERGFKASERIAWSMGEYTRMWQPVVPGLMHSAPAYQRAFADVKAFPRPLCMVFEIRPDSGITDCRCFTQQMTTYETSAENCRYWVRHGWFNPTLGDDELAAEGRGETESPRPSPPSMGSRRERRNDRSVGIHLAKEKTR